MEGRSKYCRTLSLFYKYIVTNTLTNEPNRNPNRVKKDQLTNYKR